MKPEEIRNLLGGYATGTLTEEERKLLFEAALQDQSLFDALVEEQALKETLEQPGAKQRLLAALETRREKRGWWPAWLHRPWPWAVAGTAAVAVMSLVFVVRMQQPPLAKRTIAMKTAPAAPAPSAVVAPPAASPKPAIERRAKQVAATRHAAERIAEAQPAKEAVPALPAKPVEQAENQPPLVVMPAPPTAPAQLPAATAPVPPPEAAAQTGFRADRPVSTGNVARTEVPAIRAEKTAPRAVMGALVAPAARKKADTAPYAFRYRLTPAETFQAGEPVAVHLELGEAGYVYVLYRADGGPLSVVLPPKPEAPVPAGATLDLRVPTTAGTRELAVMLLASPQPIANPAASGARPATVRQLGGMTEAQGHGPALVTVTLKAR